MASLNTKLILHYCAIFETKGHLINRVSLLFSQSNDKYSIKNYFMFLTRQVQKLVEHSHYVLQYEQEPNFRIVTVLYQKQPQCFIAAITFSNDVHQNRVKLLYQGTYHVLPLLFFLQIIKQVPNYFHKNSLILLNFMPSL